MSSSAERAAVTAEEILARVAAHPAASRLTARRLERMARVASRRLTSVTVVMENLWDSHNVSAVVRTAEGFGLDAVDVVEEPTPYRRHPAILHGADRWLRIGLHPSLEEAFAVLRARGFRLAAADLGPDCVPVDALPVDAPLAIVLGTEKAGLTGRARELADQRFSIPMAGFTASFNVSVSAAIALYDVTSRRRRHLGRASDLDLDAAVERVTAWLDSSQA